ncbi:MAG: hypothetical protein AAGF53_16355 [Pseudomonadota bacterium]
MSHRKFISIVAASAIALSGMTATPARADNDFGKIVAGAAALAIIGIALSQKKEKSVRHQNVSRSYNRPIYKDAHSYGKKSYGHNYGHKKHSKNFKHDSYGVYKGLPAHCRTTIRTKYGDRRGYRRGCLHRNYAHYNSLPHKCAISGRSYSNGGRSVVYERSCIRQHGYFTAGEG